MDGAFRVDSVAGLSLEALVALVNRVYVGYPGSFTAEEPGGYAAFCREQAIDLARSAFAVDAGGTPIGLALLGIRQDRAWVGDFGVLPEWRGRGVGRALLAGLIERARAAGLRDIRLEVATVNTAAQQLYGGAGFRVTRVLHSYQATATALGLPRAALPPDLTLSAVDAGILALDLDLPADPTPTWDHELPALLVAGGTRTFLALHNGEPAGLLHARTGPDEVEIYRLAVRDADLDVARALLAAATGNPATRLVVAYASDDSPLHTLLPALGFHELRPDLEMVYDL